MKAFTPLALVMVAICAAFPVNGAPAEKSAGKSTSAPTELTPVDAGKPEAIQKGDPVSWPGTDPYEFGCYLEKQIGAQYADFSCAALSSGKPTTMNRSGPDFPSDKAGQIKAGILDITLTWERMKLQEVSLHLDKKMTDAQVKKFLGVKSFTQPRHNVELIKTSACGGKTCVLIQNQKRILKKLVK